MRRGRRHSLLGLLLTLTWIVAASMPARTAETSGTIAVISDIHFNPFATSGIAPRLAESEPEEWPVIFAAASGQSFPRRGEDTNQALLASALSALSEKAGSADLVVVSGDLLAHRFEEIAARMLGMAPTSGPVRALDVKTARYVADGLRTALPGRPILIALGNNDSECGDYQLEPGGAFLASLSDTVRELAGPDHLAADFGQTFASGGYYAMRHPVLLGITILVVNDVLWSTDYRNTCGTTRIQAAEAMMTWLERQLEDARSADRDIWLVHHIPVGIDPYATLQASSDLSCPARVAPFLKEPFASRFALLLQEYAVIIRAGFSAHTHQDSYRLLMDANVAVAVEKVTPSISPIFGNNPAFHIFDYNRRTGDITDFSTWYLANLEQVAGSAPGEWRREYVFTQVYGEQAYSAAAIKRIADATLERGETGEQVRNNFRRLYQVSHGEIPVGALTAYACAIANLATSSYSACYCDRK
ncbi:metallophosphoesterase [Microvirga sp. VF16]|uniref:metallophosphoesterase n=1 Tax=Microvirga sp. VF16 TaxID=2807101 RepID=UPI00193DE6D7|nr:metallophosphoesterase [Microvirga sp. VF16]QRM27410.1 metallophosphoesterase [Microvirga sp. VF16]